MFLEEVSRSRKRNTDILLGIWNVRSLYRAWGTYGSGQGIGCETWSLILREMDLQEVGGGRADWMGLAQDRDGWRSLVGTVMNFRVP